MKYLITMTKQGDKYAYVLTESDYEAGGFVYADEDNFSIDSIEEAKAIREKLETYAKSKNDDFTEFFIDFIEEL